MILTAELSRRQLLVCEASWQGVCTGVLLVQLLGRAV